MHLHPRHIHVDLEVYIATIDKLTVAVAKFYYNIVVAFAQAACVAEEVYGQIIYGLGDERLGGNGCRSEFLPRKLSTIQNRDHCHDQRSPSDQASTVCTRRYDLRRNKCGNFFFALVG